MEFTPIHEVIPESHIVVFAPHYDDFLFGLGNYALELKSKGFLETKHFHILLLFSRSNYQVGSGPANYETSLARIKLATGNRIIEDTECLDELLGAHRYRYELLRENECFVRAKPFANDEMEFPHGTYPDFDDADYQIFNRLQNLVKEWAAQADTALVFPLAIKEHIDHFIIREAGITMAHKLGAQAHAHFYFQEDKPYAGIQTSEEEKRVQEFISVHHLKPRIYQGHSDQVIALAFKHYLSQVEDVYHTGIEQRRAQLQQAYSLAEDCDQLFAL
jgi:hypothetical protein